MQRQNDISQLLVQQSLTSALPLRNNPVCDGNVLQFQSFITAFECGEDGKTNNQQLLAFFRAIHQGGAY